MRITKSGEVTITEDSIIATGFQIEGTDHIRKCSAADSAQIEICEWAMHKLLVEMSKILTKGMR